MLLADDLQAALERGRAADAPKRSGVPVARTAATHDTGEAECLALIERILIVAYHMLDRGNGFVPFTAVINADRSFGIVGWQPDPRLNDSERLRHLRRIQSSQVSQGCRATALVSDVMVACLQARAVSSAISIVVDHRQGASITAYRPYHATRSSIVMDGVNLYDHPRKFFLTLH